MKNILKLRLISIILVFMSKLKNQFNFIQNKTFTDRAFKRFKISIQ